MESLRRFGTALAQVEGVLRWMNAWGLGLAVLIGCADPVMSPGRPPDVEPPPQINTEGLAGFTVEGELMVSPPFITGEPSSRVGALIELRAAGAPLEIWVRTAQGSVISEWISLPIVMMSGALQVAASRLQTPATALQLAVRATDSSRVRYLRWSGAPEREPRFEDRSSYNDSAVEALVSSLGVVQRSGWQAQPTRCDAAEDEPLKSSISLHHTLTRSTLGTGDITKALQAYEMNGLGFCDLGFHFLIAQDGTIYEGRQLRWRTGHHGASSIVGNVSIAMLGCYDSAQCAGLEPGAPSEVSIGAATRLIVALATRFGIGVNASTVTALHPCPAPSVECSGDLIAAQVPGIIAAAQAQLPNVPGADGGVPTDPGQDGGVVVPPPPPPPPPGTGSTCGEAGCSWCASSNSCNSTCTWNGSVGGQACWSAFDPCTATACWDTSFSLPACSMGQKAEDFSSGRYGVHRYSAQLPAGEPVTLTLEATGGGFQPALIVTTSTGQLIWGGDQVALQPGIQVLASRSGRGATSAQVTLQATTATSVRLHVSSWAVVDQGFSNGRVATSATYRLSSGQMCMGVPPTGPSTSESVGSPNSGTLVNGVRVTDHPQYIVANTGRNAYWGTTETIRYIREAHDAMASQHPNAQRPQIRDISVQNGGAPSGSWPHSSHESGRDADVTYNLNSCSSTSGCPISDVPLSQFDVEATWTVFEHWLRQDVAMYIFVDHGLQESLYNEARRRGATDAQLRAWIQWPRATSVREGVIRHVTNHRNHYHVRFKCPGDDSRCTP